ncbi:hypothetical protein, partial [Leptospira interrogans]|uniref:hypothetical protein n=1 Tax=Leptospira interrogans TaxID=173 RepID=UPI001C676AA2
MSPEELALAFTATKPKSGLLFRILDFLFRKTQCGSRNPTVGLEFIDIMLCLSGADSKIVLCFG